MSRDMVQPDLQRCQYKRRMRLACSITMATDTHSEMWIVYSFTLQKWLH